MAAWDAYSGVNRSRLVERIIHMICCLWVHSMLSRSCRLGTGLFRPAARDSFAGAPLNSLDEMRSAPMSRFQIRAVTVCLLVNVLDGFDVLVIAFVAPEIAREWAISPEALGVLFSSGLAGMTLGSLLLAPLADVYGRRPTIILSLLATSIGMVASSYAETLFFLAFTRVLTGLGIGAMLASIATIVAEYSSARRRAAAVGFSLAGYPIGAIFGGLVTVALIEAFNWQTVFVVGGLLTAATIPLVMLYVPESLDFLLTRRTADTLPKVNRLLAKMDRAPLSELPLQADVTRSGNRILGLFQPALRGPTLLIWSCFFLTMSSLYFAQIWTPKIMVDAGFDLSQGVSAGVLIQVGALIGIFALGILTAKLTVQTTAALLMVFGFVAMAVFSQAMADPTWLMLVAVCVGLGVNASVVALYALIPEIYPPQVRTTATGWAIGAGRLSAVFAPIVAGYLLGAGVEVSTLYLLFGLPMAVAIGCVLAARSR